MTARKQVFKLRFPEKEIAKWAKRYSYESENRIEAEIAPQAKGRGYLTREEFLAICDWKTPRSRPLVMSNPTHAIEVATQAAFESKTEKVKIGVLLMLRGVSFPTASVVLHFCDKRKYPILDYRALWSLGFLKPPTYSIEFWVAYTNYVREISDRTNQSMRTIDRALWQYSKERQRTIGTKRLS